MPESVFVEIRVPAESAEWLINKKKNQAIRNSQLKMNWTAPHNIVPRVYIVLLRREKLFAHFANSESAWTVPYRWTPREEQQRLLWKHSTRSFYDIDCLSVDASNETTLLTEWRKKRENMPCLDRTTHIYIHRRPNRNSSQLYRECTAVYLCCVRSFFFFFSCFFLIKYVYILMWFVVIIFPFLPSV